MKNTEKNIETSNQNQEPQELQSGMYSDVMEMLHSIFGLKNPTINERLMKQQPTQQDNTIEVTFLKRRSKG